MDVYHKWLESSVVQNESLPKRFTLTLGQMKQDMTMSELLNLTPLDLVRSYSLPMQTVFRIRTYLLNQIVGDSENYLFLAKNFWRAYRDSIKNGLELQKFDSYINLAN